ncbi:hypothetical protein JXR93_13020, partial [bacterium]|nr:hypothetical protein [bacterium]
MGPILYLLKISYHFLWTVFISFFLTSFLLDNGDNSIFFNISPKNYEKEITKDIKTFINSKKNESALSIKKYGTSFYPVFFKLLKNDVAHKDEYIELYKKTIPNLLNIQEQNSYDITYYIQEWEKIEATYTKERVAFILNLWKTSLLSTENLLIELNKIGSISVQVLPFFLVDEFSYSDFNKIEPLLKFLVAITPSFPFKESDFSVKSEEIWDWWRGFVIENRYYYLPNTLSLYIKVLLTQTEFYKWLQQVFTISFGTINGESVFVVMENYFLATLLSIFSIIIFSYFISSKIVLIFYKNSKNSFFKAINFILTTFTLLPLALLPIIFWAINQFVDIERG